MVAKNHFARIIVERGDPYEKGRCIALPQDQINLGRATQAFKPDISFDSLLISRKHCCISQLGETWTIVDLGSKHGTMLNNQSLTPNLPNNLHNGDKITLASSIVVLRFVIAPELEKTLDFESTQSLKNNTAPLSVLPIVVDTAKKILYIKKREVPLSVKEWCLLELLYNNRNKLVSYADIRTAVWVERQLLDNNEPDVGLDEINAILYRLRRKFGNCRNLLKTRRGQGCILEIK
jgi:pSer/pThr/pTyr-binding forkhead associated (FHA) protein